MTAPVSDHQRVARRAIAVQEFFEATTDQQRRELIGAFVDLLIAAPNVDSAASSRPLPAGDQSGQHDARAIPTKGNAGAAGDDHRDALTTTAAAFYRPQYHTRARVPAAEAPAACADARARPGVPPLGGQEGGAMIAMLLHDPLAGAPLCAEFSDADDGDLQAFDDGTVRVTGVLAPDDREALLLTHVEGGLDSDGRVIWYPKEAPYAA